MRVQLYKLYALKRSVDFANTLEGERKPIGGWRKPIGGYRKPIGGYRK